MSLNTTTKNIAREYIAKPTLPAVLIVAFVAVIARVVSWPGFATHDTIYLVQDALAGTYTTYHPLLNGLLMRWLAVPFKSFLVFSTLQIVVCVLWFSRSLILISAANDSTRLQSILSAVVWALGIPSVIYLGMIWKDIPIAYGIAYIAALGYALRQKNAFELTWFDSALLFLAIVLTIGLRHGMEFNLLLYPLLFGIRKVASSLKLKVAYFGALAILIALGVLARTPLVKNDEVHMIGLKIAAVSQPFLQIVSNANGYTSDDKSYDAMIATRAFGPDYAAAFTPDYFKNKVVETDLGDASRSLEAIVKRTPRLCLLNLGPCFSGRITMLMETLQPSTVFGGMTFYDLGNMPNCATTYGMDEEKCKLISEYEAAERPVWLMKLNATIMEWITVRGTVQNLFVWNLFPSLLLILFCLLAFNPNHALWTISGFYVVQMGLPFATSMANDFRYYYFLAPYFALFLPVALMCGWWKIRAKARVGAVGRLD